MENKGYQEILNNNVDGIIFRNENDIDLKINLLRLVQNEEKLVSLQKLGRNTVKKSYSINSVVYKYLQLYRSLI